MKNEAAPAVFEMRWKAAQRSLFRNRGYSSRRESILANYYYMIVIQHFKASLASIRVIPLFSLLSSRMAKSKKLSENGPLSLNIIPEKDRESRLFEYDKSQAFFF